MKVQDNTNKGKEWLHPIPFSKMRKRVKTQDLFDSRS